VSDRYLIAGLGNPGRKYKNTRHNAGFMVIDKLAQEFNGSFKKAKFTCEQSEIKIAYKAVILAKPLTYMNNSGLAVFELMQYYKIDPSQLLLVYDDADLPLGRLRMRAQGSAGGHKGVASVIRHLKTQEFPRLRVGIGSEFGKEEMVNFVLSSFSKKERQELNNIISSAVDAVKGFIVDGLDKTMNWVNSA